MILIPITALAVITISIHYVFLYNSLQKTGIQTKALIYKIFCAYAIGPIALFVIVASPVTMPFVLTFGAKSGISLLVSALLAVVFLGTLKLLIPKLTPKLLGASFVIWALASCIFVYMVSGATKHENEALAALILSLPLLAIVVPVVVYLRQKKGWAWGAALRRAFLTIVLVLFLIYLLALLIRFT